MFTAREHLIDWVLFIAIGLKNVRIERGEVTMKKLALLENKLLETSESFRSEADYLSSRYFREDDGDGWQDDEAFGRYITLINCAVKIEKIIAEA
jgi:hypothetical protein